jgi:hypothetical protein
MKSATDKENNPLARQTKVTFVPGSGSQLPPEIRPQAMSAIQVIFGAAHQSPWKAISNPAAT